MRALSLLALAACSTADVQVDTHASGTFEVAGGELLLVHISAEGAVEVEAPPPAEASLDQGALDALDAVPEWVRADLAHALSALPPEEADRYAEVILTSDADWADEVGWSIATTHPALLTWVLGHDMEWIFAENAAAIYEVAPQVAYADLVELDDGRTTLDLVGEEGVVQLDPELYYHHVVYPRAYLDLPAANGESFWRSYWLEDDRYGSTLVEAVAGEASVQDAAVALGEWIQSFMSFGYGTNTIYPLEVYWEQYGSCGEYSILTTAAARTALLPVVSVSDRADDHEWNELWDGRWIMWDNSLGEIGDNPNYPYLDWPEIFDNDSYSGSGVLGEVDHVWRFRTDEYVWPSDLYTHYTEVIIEVSDGDKAPVEGARVTAMSKSSGYLPSAWAPTDHLGQATLWLGDDEFFGFLVEHPVLGTLPDGEISYRVRTDDDDVEPKVEGYRYKDDPLPAVVVDGGAVPEGPRVLRASFEVLGTTQRVVNLVTEGYDLGQTYPHPLEGGAVTAYLVHTDDLDALRAGDAVQGHEVLHRADAADLELVMPAGGRWSLVLDNRACAACDRLVTLEAEVLDPSE